MAEGIYRQRRTARSLELTVSRSYFACLVAMVLAALLLAILAWGFIAQPITLAAPGCDARPERAPDPNAPDVIGCGVMIVEPGLHNSGLERPLLGLAIVLFLSAFFLAEKTVLILDEGRDRLTLRRSHPFGAQDTVRVLSTLSGAVTVKVGRKMVGQLEFADGERLSVGSPQRRVSDVVGVVNAIHRFVPTRDWAERIG